MFLLKQKYLQTEDHNDSDQQPVVVDLVNSKKISVKHSHFGSCPVTRFGTGQTRHNTEINELSKKYDNLTEKCHTIHHLSNAASVV